MKRADILTNIHKMRPVDTGFIAGRWHHDRATVKGVILEARVLLKSLITPRNANRRFLIIGRARSGTTLLTRMLNSHTEIQCDGEVLKRMMLAPRAYLDRLASKSNKPVYGAKLLSYQMVQVHRMHAPERWLEQLADDGVLLIHLERGTFFQTLSLAVAQTRRQYHSDKGAKALRDRLRLDPQNFLDRIIWSEALLAYERAALEYLEPLHIVYERDLCDPEAQTATFDKIGARLGLARESVSVSVDKVLPTNPADILENYDEIRMALEIGGYGHLLP